MNEYRELAMQFLEIGEEVTKKKISIVEAEEKLKNLGFFDNTEFRKYFAISDEGEFLCMLSQEFSIRNAELLEFYKSKKEIWDLVFTHKAPCRSWCVKIRQGLGLHYEGPLELLDLLKYTDTNFFGKFRLSAVGSHGHSRI